MDSPRRKQRPENRHLGARFQPLPGAIAAERERPKPGCLRGGRLNSHFLQPRGGRMADGQGISWNTEQGEEKIVQTTWGRRGGKGGAAWPSGGKLLQLSGFPHNATEMSRNVASHAKCKTCRLEERKNLPLFLGAIIGWFLFWQDTTSHDAKTPAALPLPEQGAEGAPALGARVQSPRSTSIEEWAKKGRTRTSGDRSEVVPEHNFRLTRRPRRRQTRKCWWNQEINVSQSQRGSFIDQTVLHRGGESNWSRIGVKGRGTNAMQSIKVDQKVGTKIGGGGETAVFRGQPVGMSALPPELGACSGKERAKEEREGRSSSARGKITKGRPRRGEVLNTGKLRKIFGKRTI